MKFQRIQDLRTDADMSQRELDVYKRQDKDCLLSHIV